MSVCGHSDYQLYMYYLNFQKKNFVFDVLKMIDSSVSIFVNVCLFLFIVVSTYASLFIITNQEKTVFINKSIERLLPKLALFRKQDRHFGNAHFIFDN